jgi:hypothetical protein
MIKYGRNMAFGLGEGRPAPESSKHYMIACQQHESVAIDLSENDELI